MPKRARSSLAKAFEELKYKDVSSTSTALAPSTATMLSCVNVTQGSAATERVGQKIAVEKLDVQFLMMAKNAAASVAGGGNPMTASGMYKPMVYHFAVVVDKQWNSDTVATEIPLIAASGTQAVFTRLGSARQLVRDLDFTKRYRVLGIKTIAVKPYIQDNHLNAGNEYVSVTWPEILVKMSLNFKTPIIVEYGAGNTSGSITNVDVNLIGALIYNESAYLGANLNSETWAISSRIRYYD